MNETPFSCQGFTTMTHSIVPASSRLMIFLIGCLLAVVLFGYLSPALPTARAQEEGAAAADEGAKAPDAKPEEKKPDNILIHIMKSLGWVFGLVLMGVSIALMSLVVLLIMELRMTTSIPPGFVEDFTDTVNKRRFKEAYEMAKEDGSFLGRVMTTGMSRLQYGIEDAREAAFNMVEAIKAGKDQMVTYLATIGTLGPMLGLVGTVWGMIKSFMVLGSGGSPNPAKLAEGISHALVVTLVGIGLSVPAIFAHAFFRNRLIGISMDVSNIADDLLTQMYHNSKKPAAEAPAPAAEVRGAATAAIKK